MARIAVEDDLGRKSKKWVPLEAGTGRRGAGSFQTLLVERKENRLRPIGLSPMFADYAGLYLGRQKTSGKKADTIVTESGHLRRWIEGIGHLRLDKIRARHITTHLHRLPEKKKSARTWDDVKAGVKKAYDDLKDSFKQTHQWLNEKIAP